MSRKVFVLGCLLLLSACNGQDKPTRQKEAKPSLVTVVRANTSAITSEQTLPGTLEALHTVHLYTQETGRILRMAHYPGDKVSKETELVKLDDSLIRSEYQKAVAVFHKAEMDLKRINQLRDQKLISEDEQVRAQTTMEQVRAERDAINTRLAHTSIRAPFDGIISERLREPGDVVAIHQHVMTIYDPKKLIIKLQLSEFSLASIKLKQSARIRIDAFASDTFSGYVSRIYPTIDPNSRQGTIEIMLDPVPAIARPGQLTRVTLKAVSPPVLTVPGHVIRHDTQGDYVVLIDNNNIAHFTRVRIGKQIDDRVEILEGITEGAQIVSEGFLELRDGNKVSIQTNNSGESASKHAEQKPDQNNPSGKTP